MPHYDRVKTAVGILPFVNNAGTGIIRRQIVVPLPNIYCTKRTLTHEPKRIGYTGYKLKEMGEKWKHTWSAYTPLLYTLVVWSNTRWPGLERFTRYAFRNVLRKRPKRNNYNYVYIIIIIMIIIGLTRCPFVRRRGQQQGSVAKWHRRGTLWWYTHGELYAGNERGITQQS